MQEISTITIGLVLLGFVLGAVIVALASQSRSRRQGEAYEAQVRRMRDDERKQRSNLEAMQQAQVDAEAKLQEAERAIQAEARETEILRAQFAEEQEAAYGLEDRLNAAEARVLTVEAQLAEQRRELEERTDEIERRAIAQDQLKAAHKRLAEAHFQSRTQRERLLGELAGRGNELDSLQTHLDALQTTVAALLHNPARLSGDSGEYAADEVAGTMSIVPAQLQEVAFAKAEVQAALRQRDHEVTELRSQLASMRYSLNVLTSTGAALAAMAGDQEQPRESETALARTLPRQTSVSTNLEAVTEQLAGLEGMIADWFSDLSIAMPYNASLLRSFSGVDVARRYGAPPNEIAGQVDAQVEALMRLTESDDALLDDEELDRLLQESASPVSPDVMLAAIKAANSAALRRSETRQNELMAALLEARAQVEQMRTVMASESALVLETEAAQARILTQDELAEDSADASMSTAAASGAGDSEVLGTPSTDPELQESSVLVSGASSGEEAPGAAYSDAGTVASTSLASSRNAQPAIPAGIPRADVPTPTVPRPTVPRPAEPGPAASQARSIVRRAWGTFMRRVGSVLNRQPRS